jgi:PKD repeat protein
VNENQPLTVNVSAADPDGDAITSLTATGLPAGASFVADTTNTGGTLSWTPGYSQAGSYTVTFTATNALSGTASTVITVNGTDRAPVVTAPATVSGPSGTPITVNVTAADPDGDAITALNASNLPAGASFAAGPGDTTGTLTWTPVPGDAGNHVVTFIATNALSDSVTTTITVTVGDRAPVVTAPATASGKVGATITVNVTVLDPDGDPIATLTASAPPGAVFTAGAGDTSGTFTWAPGAGDVGDHPVIFTASNALSGSDTTTITVLPPNQPPTAALAVTPSTGNAPLSVSASAAGSTDSDGSVATYSFDFGDGTVLGPQTSPTATHSYAAGNWTVTVTVTDNEGAVGSKSAPVIAAAAPGQTNLVTNPSFEVNTTGWNSYSGGTLLRVAGGFDGGWGLQVAGASNNSSFGCNDSPNWVASVPGPGATYRFTAWVRSAIHTGTVKLQVREYRGATKIAAMYSTGVTLSPTWQKVTVDYVASSSGSTLDFQVVDFPRVANEVFITDNISIYDITNAGVMAARQAVPEPADSTLDLGGRIPLRATLCPSPLRSQSSLVFVTSRPGPLLIVLYDISGRRVRAVLDEPNAPAGLHQVPVDGRDERGQMLAAGVYFYRIRALEGSSGGRFVVVR